MEQKQPEVIPQQITEQMHNLIELMKGVSAHFVFNMDEIGHQDSADRQREICFVPFLIEKDAFFFLCRVWGNRLR
jgi:hypothetical protein